MRASAGAFVGKIEPLMRWLPCVFVLFTLTAAGQQATVGTLVFPNSGSAAAQKPFLHGLAQLHNFEYEDAAAAFQEAEKIDPFRDGLLGARR
jgi:hypothetical protein